MRIVLWEMRKILRPRRVLIAALIAAALYWMFPLMFLSTVTGQGLTANNGFLSALEMTQAFGPTLEVSEYEELGVWLDELYQKADEIVRTDPDIAPLGLSGYQALLEARDQMETEWYEAAGAHSLDDRPEELKRMDEAVWRIFFDISLEPESHVTLGACIQALEGTRQVYEREVLWQPDGAARSGIMFGAAWENGLRPYLSCLLALIVLLTASLIAPVLTRDRLARTDELQMASRRGRRIYTSQLWAVLLTTFLTVTVFVVVGAVELIGNVGIGPFLDHPARSFMSYNGIQIPMTLGQYLLSMAGFAFALSLATATALFCLSGHSRHSGTLTLKTIAVVVVTGGLAGAVLTWNNLFGAYTPYGFNQIWAEVLIPVALLCAGVAMALGFVARRRCEG